MRTAKTDQTGRVFRLICLHWVHMLFCRFCHALVLNVNIKLPNCHQEKMRQNMFEKRPSSMDTFPLKKGLFVFVLFLFLYKNDFSTDTFN